VKVLLVGTLPPRGGSAARRFATEAARRSARGDFVETLSSDPLSVSHRNASLRGRRLPRQLRAHAKVFDAVELRVEADLDLTTRSAGSLAGALSSYRHVTLFLDSPVPFAGDASLLSKLLAVAHEVVLATEADRRSLDPIPAGPELVVVASDALESAAATPPWPASGAASLQERVLEVVRRRARGEESHPTRASMLVTATDRVYPSFRGSSIWVVKRVIGKTRGAVTKILRPTPRQPA
jgi:hypothetical protein